MRHRNTVQKFAALAQPRHVIAIVHHANVVDFGRLRHLGNSTHLLTLSPHVMHRQAVGNAIWADGKAVSIPVQLMWCIHTDLQWQGSESTRTMLVRPVSKGWQFLHARHCSVDLQLHPPHCFLRPCTENSWQLAFQPLRKDAGAHYSAC